MLFCLCFGIAITNFTLSNGIVSSAETELSFDESLCDMGKASIIFSSEKVQFSENKITATYSIDESLKAVSVNYECNGLNVVSCELLGNKVDIVANYNYSADNHILNLNVCISTGENLSAKLFAIDNDCGIFISPFSINDAYEKYFDYAMSVDVLTGEECQTIRNDLYSLSVYGESFLLPPNETYHFPNEEVSSIDMPMQDLYNNTSPNSVESPILSNKDTYIQGTLNCIDDDGDPHPLRRVMVKIYDSDLLASVNIGTVYTDNNGNFSFTFRNKDSALDLENGGLDIFIRIYAGDDSAMVKIGTSNNKYYYQSPITENIQTGSTKVYRYFFDMTSDLGQAFQISQAVLTARDFAWAMMDGDKPSDMVVRYPYSHTYYINANKALYLVKENGRNSSVPNSYASWDVIMHEYGHHISYDMDIINPISFNCYG